MDPAPALGSPAAARHFPATALTFDDAPTRALVDRTAEQVRALFAADLAARPSRHVYVSDLPEDLQRAVHALRSDPRIAKAILRGAGEDARIVPLPETDELYLCHHNLDRGGDEGLFAKHYDGNLRFLPFGAVVRALIYLRSDGSYEVTFADSGLSRRFASYDVALLDFHRELHWVEGEHRPGAPERILLKCNALVLAPGEQRLERLLRGLNTGQFWVVKAAMEYSKSPRTPAQRAVGLLCNLVRTLNNAHPLLPHALFVTAALALFGGLGALLR